MRVRQHRLPGYTGQTGRRASRPSFPLPSTQARSRSRQETAIQAKFRRKSGILTYFGQDRLLPNSKYLQCRTGGNPGCTERPERLFLGIAPRAGEGGCRANPSRPARKGHVKKEKCHGEPRTQYLWNGITHLHTGYSLSFPPCHSGVNENEFARQGFCRFAYRCHETHIAAIRPILAR
jgi:hypothetical protein